MQTILAPMINTNLKQITPKLATRAGAFTNIKSVGAQRLSVRVQANQQGPMDAVGPQKNSLAN